MCHGQPWGSVKGKGKWRNCGWSPIAFLFAPFKALPWFSQEMPGEAALNIVGLFSAPFPVDCPIRSGVKHIWVYAALPPAPPILGYIDGLVYHCCGRSGLLSLRLRMDFENL